MPQLVETGHSSLHCQLRREDRTGNRRGWHTASHVTGGGNSDLHHISLRTTPPEKTDQENLCYAEDKLDVRGRARGFAAMRGKIDIVGKVAPPANGEVGVQNQLR